MRSYVAAFTIAAIISWLATPVVRRLALRLGAVSQPGGRNVHRQSVARLGGVSICLAFLVPIAATFFFPESVVASDVIGEPLKMAGILGGGVFICAIGAIDDVRGMRAKHKLLAQVAVGVSSYACGFRIEGVLLPWIGSVPMGALALPVTVLWIVGIINAINLIDGLDGLAAGVVFFAGATNFTVAALIVVQPFTAVLLAAMLGAVFAFLFYNSAPARIFMGDSGSYFLGFLLALTSLSGGAPKTSTAVALLVPVLALGVPIFDTLFAMVRRILERRPLFSADRRHVHHRLLDLGITHQRAVLILYGVSVLLTVAAIALAVDRSWELGATLVITSVALVVIIRSFSGFRRREDAWTPDASQIRRGVPALGQSLAEAKSVDDIYDALRAFRETADLDFIEVLDGANESSSVAFRWPEAEVTGGAGYPVATIYPIGSDGAARASLRVGFRSDVGDLSNKTDILLQVVTDLVESHLTRVGSGLAPNDATEESSAPRVVAARRGRTAQENEAITGQRAHGRA